jgi:phosphopentomutase
MPAGRPAGAAVTAPRDAGETDPVARLPDSRVVLIVLDGAGCGALPDAAAYGDEGSDTLGHVAARVPLDVPNLRRLGLGEIVPLGGDRSRPSGAWGRMTEASPGKDSVTGHWELAGLVLDRPFPTFPNGFPPDLIAALERRIGRPTLGNVVASGTEILDRLGSEHLDTGAPIVYTSADSVLQIAAHEAVVPPAVLEAICKTAFDLAVRGLGVGRVIARPFTGTPGAFHRTAGRRDYAHPPSGETLLDRLSARGWPVVAIGKVQDLFAGRGITRAVKTAGDADGLDALVEALEDTSRGLVFVNLVDFDTIYGHRNDVAGFAANLERFDARLPDVLSRLRPADLLVITGDHGNDPTTASTDHAREYVPLVVCGPGVRGGVDLGTRTTFADVGQTAAAWIGVGPLAHGTSFLEEIGGDDS